MRTLKRTVCMRPSMSAPSNRRSTISLIDLAFAYFRALRVKPVQVTTMPSSAAVSSNTERKSRTTPSLTFAPPTSKSLHSITVRCRAPFRSILTSI